MTPNTQSVLTTIHEWAHERGRLVVGIDGYTGVGKTTILDALAKADRGIVPVHRDDFLFPRTVVRDLIATSADPTEVFEQHATDEAKLTRLIDAFREGAPSFSMLGYDHVEGTVTVPLTYDLTTDILIVEGVFLFHPNNPSGRWDQRVFLRGNLDRIDARRVAREKALAGDAYYPETRPGSYFRLVTTAYRRYCDTHHPEQLADLVIDVDDDGAEAP